MKKRNIAIIGIVLIALAFIVLWKKGYVGAGNKTTKESQSSVTAQEGEKPSEENLTPVTYEEALKNGMPTLVEFKTDTCPVCVQIEPMMDQLVKDYQGKANVVIVNLSDSDNLSLGQKHNVRAVPSFAFFTKEGELVAFTSEGKDPITLIEGAVDRKDVDSVLKELGAN